MNLHAIKEKFRIIDPRGLSGETILNMRMLIIAVMGGMVWSNITNGIAFTGYWKELGVNDTLYGVLLALPAIANAFQFISSYYMERTLKRTRLFIVTALIQRISWLPFAFVPFIVPLSQPIIKIWIASLLVIISASMMPFMNVSFFSICDDVVPIKMRGRYFASRSKVSTLMGLLAGLFTGVLLDALPGMRGYCAVFVIASVMGTLDIVCFFFMKLPPMKASPRRKPMRAMMGEVLRDKNYMKIVSFCSLWLFFVYLASPYFNVYMRDGMGMTNLQMTLCAQIASNIMLILLVTKWGRALDRFGSKPIIFVSCLLSGIMPMLWVFTGKGNLTMVTICNIISGATWCAYELGAQNLFMGQAKGESKSMYFAVYFMFTQLLGNAFGSAVGGWLLDNALCKLEPLRITLLGRPLTRYNYLFAISAIGRTLVILAILPQIKESGAESVKQFLTSIKSDAGRMLILFHNSKLVRRISRRK